LLQVRGYSLSDKPDQDYFRISVKRESGAEADTPKGYPNDTIIVDRSLTAKHGDVVLARVNSEFTLKRFYNRGGDIQLIAENKNYAPIVFIESDEMEIWGVVKNSIRNL